jgi:hypothetical protein
MVEKDRRARNTRGRAAMAGKKVKGSRVSYIGQVQVHNKVEGAQTNTPSKINTYKRFPIFNSTTWNCTGGVGVYGSME